MTIHITDHEAQMLDALFPEWREGLDVRRLIGVLAEKIQEAEDVYNDLITLRLLDTATGDSLDQYGDLVNFVRGNLTDDEYRLILRGKILANRSGHLASQIGNIAAIFFDSPTYGAHYIHNQPAGFQIQVSPESSLSEELITRAFEVLETSAPAGVKLTSIDTVDPVDAFTLDIGPGLDNGKLGGILAT